jgi:hypothetical protein
VVALAERALTGAGEAGAGEALASEHRSGSDRRLLFIHLREERLLGHELRAELHDGTPLSGETLLRLACDSGICAVKTDDSGNVLDMGRKRRVPSVVLMAATSWSPASASCSTARRARTENQPRCN